MIDGICNSARRKNASSVADAYAYAYVDGTQVALSSLCTVRVHTGFSVSSAGPGLLINPFLFAAARAGIRRIGAHAKLHFSSSPFFERQAAAVFVAKLRSENDDRV